MPTAITAGIEYCVTVIARDIHESAIHHGGHIITASVESVDETLQRPSVSCSCVDNGNGTYTVKLISFHAGQYHLNIKSRDGHIAASPYNVATIAGSPCVSSFVASGQGLHTTVAQQVSEVMILARDRYNNSCQLTKPVDITFKSANSTEDILRHCEMTNEPSKFVYTALSQASLYQLHLSYDGISLPGSPWTVWNKPAVTSASHCIVTVHKDQWTAGDRFSVRCHAYDEFDNLRDIGGDTVQMILESEQQQLKVQMRDMENGCYYGEVDVHVAGQYQLQCIVNDDICPASQIITVIPSNVKASACEVITQQQYLQAGETLDINLRLFDAYHNAVCDDTAIIVANITGPISIPLAIEKKDDSYALSALISVAESYTCDIRVNGEQINGSPFIISVKPGKPCGARCIVANVTTGAHTAGTASLLRVTAIDEFGNMLQQGRDDVCLSLSGPAAVLTTVQDNADGTYLLSFKATHAGTYDIIVTINKQPIPFNSTVVIVSSSPVAQTSTVAITTACAGSLTHAFVMSCDAFGNKVQVGGASVVATLSGEADMTANVLDLNDGTYIATVAPTKAGEYLLALSLNGSPIAGSPFRIRITSASTVASSCLLEGDGLVNAIAGKTAHFDIIARDQFNNITDDSSNITATIIGVPHTPTVECIDTGRYRVSYVILKTGEYAISVLVNGHAAVTAPYKIHVQAGQVVASKCIVSGSGLSGAVAGTWARLILQAQDMYSNKCIATDSVVAEMDSGVCEVQNNDDGTYGISFTASKAGVHTLSVRMNGRHVSSSPYSIHIAAASVDPDCCIVTGPGLSNCNAEEETYILVQTCDRFGNRLLHDAATVAVNVTTEAMSVDANVTSNRDGTYIAMFTPPATGVIQIAVSVSGKQVKGSPYIVHVPPLAPHAQNCKCKATTDSWVAGSVIEFDIQAMDVFGTVCSAGHQFTAEILGNDAVAHVISHENGSYTLRTSIIRAGLHHIAVRYGDRQVSGSPVPIRVTPDKTCSALCTAKGNGLHAAIAGVTSQFVVRTVDRFGNALKSGGEIVRVEMQGCDIKAAVVDNGDGSYTVAYTPTKSYGLCCDERLLMPMCRGLHKLDVLVNDQPCFASPFTCNVSAGTPSASNSVVLGV